MNKTSRRFPKIHETQWLILRKMMTKEFWRFNEIKFVDMDPKKFTYHLKQLRNLGLVSYREDLKLYALDTDGKLLMDYFRNIPSFAELPINTSVFLYVKSKGKILVVKRTKIPSLNHVGTPSSNTSMAKFLDETANELLKSFGLEGKLTFCLILEMLYHQNNGLLFSHDCFYVFYSDSVTGTVSQFCEEGELFWLTPRELLGQKKGYKNTRDIVGYFEGKNFNVNKLHFISRRYKKEY